MSHSAAMSAGVVEAMVTREESMVSAAVVFVLAIEVDLGTVRDAVLDTVVAPVKEGAPPFELVLVTESRTLGVELVLLIRKGAPAVVLVLVSRNGMLGVELVVLIRKGAPALEGKEEDVEI